MARITNMRSIMDLLEDPSYRGPRDHPDISYSAVTTKGEITKVIANLSSYESGKYTRLGRNLKRIETLTAEIAQLKDEVKADTKEAIVDLFNADDVCRTRVVETVGFTFELTKDPKPTNTVKYAEVLKELESHMTPELIEILSALKDKFSSTVQKSPSLKARDKAVESISLNEGWWDSLRSLAHRFYRKILGWAKSYDNRLSALRGKAGLFESLVETPSRFNDHLDELLDASAEYWRGWNEDHLSDDQIKSLERRLNDLRRRFIAMYNGDI